MVTKKKFVILLPLSECSCGCVVLWLLLLLWRVDPPFDSLELNPRCRTHDQALNSIYTTWWAAVRVASMRRCCTRSTAFVRCVTRLCILGYVASPLKLCALPHSLVDCTQPSFHDLLIPVREQRLVPNRRGTVSKQVDAGNRLSEWRQNELC